MKNIFIFIALLFISFSSNSQYVVTIEARVIDAITKTPIPYVNVGFVDKAIGSVTNEEGFLSIEFDENRIQANDIIQFSMVGYQTESYTFKQLIERFQTSNTVALSKEIFDLNEVVLETKWGKSSIFGHQRISKKTMGYWKDKKALGGEIATLINLKKGKQKLTKLYFNVIENSADSIKVRVNIYDYKKRRPSNNLLLSPIFKVLAGNIGAQAIDLSPYNIIVDNNVVVSLELVEVYGENIAFALAGSFDQGISYLKYVSQDKWMSSPSRSVAFSVASRPFQPSELITSKQVDKTNVTVYWDVSWSMKDRALDKELDVLKEYLKKANTKNVNIKTFSSTILEEQTFSIPIQNTEIDDFLRSQKYLGATRLDALPLNEDTDSYLLFTDGIFKLGDAPSQYSNAPLYTISSNFNTDATMLNDLSTQNEGRFLNLNTLSKREAIERLIAPGEMTFNNSGSQNDDHFKITGKINFNNIPLQGCYVSVKNSFNEIQTDKDGNYSLLVKKGDTITYEFINMLPKEVIVTDETILNITLKSEYESLDEILLKGTIVKIEEASKEEDEKERKKRCSGIASYSLDSSEFPKYDLYLADVIRDQFPGVRIDGEIGEVEVSYIMGRSKSSKVSNAPLFVVDGIPFQDPPHYIDVKTISNITVEPSISGASRYGQAGANGVIFITTITNQDSPHKTIESLLAKNNDYNEVTPIFNTNKDLSVKSLLFDGQSTTDSYNIFKKNVLENPTNLNIYLDFFNHIKGNKDLERRVLMTLYEVAEENTRVLRALSFYLEKEGHNDLALIVRKKILNISPNEVQSYLDNASSYVSIGDYQKAFEIYKFLLNNDFENFNISQDALSLVETEVKHLLTKYRDKVTYNDVPSSFIETTQIIDLRYVVSWSDPQLEFELQFVNPNDKFYKWSHTLIDSDGAFNEDLKNGFLSREFILDDQVPKGKWIMNVKGMSEKLPSIPGFMKIEAYKNYGDPNESKTVKIIPFDQLDKKYTIETASF